ncbi:hypothetical protein DFH09DRAFT_1176615, partial [Mycena vulgaris]
IHSRVRAGVGRCKRSVNLAIPGVDKHAPSVPVRSPQRQFQDRDQVRSTYAARTFCVLSARGVWNPTHLNEFKIAAQVCDEICSYTATLRSVSRGVRTWQIRLVANSALNSAAINCSGGASSHWAYTGAFFPKAHHLVVAGGKFKSITNITQASPAVPSGAQFYSTL